MVGKRRGAILRRARPTKAGTLLRATRKKKGLVLREAADATGLTWSGIGYVEKGRTVPTIKTCYLLAKVYRISFSKLIMAVLEDEL